MAHLTQEEIVIIVRALSFYGKDLADNEADTSDVLALINEFSHLIKEKA